MTCNLEYSGASMSVQQTAGSRETPPRRGRPCRWGNCACLGWWWWFPPWFSPACGGVLLVGKVWVKAACTAQGTPSPQSAPQCPEEHCGIGWDHGTPSNNTGKRERERDATFTIMAFWETLLSKATYNEYIYPKRENAVRMSQGNVTSLHHLSCITNTMDDKPHFYTKSYKREQTVNTIGPLLLENHETISIKSSMTQHATREGHETDLGSGDSDSRNGAGLT